MAIESAEQLIDFNLLPGQLKLIARQCGLECMWAVWRHYGGGHVSVPFTVDACHPLAATLGLEYAQLLCAQFAPTTLYIAKGHGAQMAIRLGVRNLTIVEERKAGRTLFEIARAYDLSERQVINVLKQSALETSQTDLFD